MADTTGLVTYIKINREAGRGLDLCFFGLQPQGGSQPEMFILWWAANASEPLPTAADWILRNACIALLRDSLLNKIPVTVSTDDDVGAVVAKVQLGVSGS